VRLRPPNRPSHEQRRGRRLSSAPSLGFVFSPYSSCSVALNSVCSIIRERLVSRRARGFGVLPTDFHTPVRYLPSISGERGTGNSHWHNKANSLFMPPLLQKGTLPLSWVPFPFRNSIVARVSTDVKTDADSVRQLQEPTGSGQVTTATPQSGLDVAPRSCPAPSSPSPCHTQEKRSWYRSSM